MVAATQKSDHQKVCVIVPYFGRWPKYFSLFLQSIENHSVLHFYFYTDITPPVTAPSNVKFISTSLQELRNRFSEKLQLECGLYSAYKLCDIRAAYGHLFADDIRSFSHWGWGDIDVVYGNIDHFINQELLKSYDILSFRKEYLSGSLCIFRNSESANMLYKKSKDYQMVFSNEKHFSFCECNFLWQDITKDNDSIFEPKDIHHMSYIVKKANKNNELKARFSTEIKESIPDGDYVHASPNSVKDKSGREFLFYHFITEKKRKGFRFPVWPVSPKEFFVNRFGFFLPSQFHGIKFWSLLSVRILYHRYKVLHYYLGRVFPRVFNQ